MILVPTTPEFLEEAAKFISPCDLEEFNKMQAGRDLKATLLRSLGPTSMTILHKGNVLATGGSNECLWFVTTRWTEELTPRERVEMLRLLKKHLEVCRAVMPADQLSNFVYEHNHTHRRLLDALGARYGFYQEYSPAGFPFRQFWL
ncbi:internal virion protein A [Pseudomonas phage phiIBB-PF7A]|uniref:Internal virion protein A n=2 Tax=Pifdecavirus TaxID=2732691 RepID=A0A0A0YRY8_9CAUD|nr:internal virion protein [Pseudomonas phage phiIBB-PF7A]YP_009145634.1 internal virion protein [Pseudomonas phage Pf-10]ADV35695.1 internal virion protein A [Pseudomonas phage phiIBB-PF7A]AIX12999.1 internal virion protein A [Pseudomonas phage Pf-10]